MDRSCELTAPSQVGAHREAARAHARARFQCSWHLELAPAGPRHRLALDGGPRGRHEGGAASKERAVSIGWLRQGLRGATGPNCWPPHPSPSSDFGEDLVWALQVGAIRVAYASVTRLEMLACDVQCHFLRRSALLRRPNEDKKVTECPDGARPPKRCRLVSPSFCTHPQTHTKY